MPWNGSANAGFTIGSPWLPLNPDYETRNVAAFTADRRCILSLYRRLIALRREHTALSVGRYLATRVDNDVLAYERSDDDMRLLVVLNFAKTQRQVMLAPGTGRSLTLLSTCLDREGEPVHDELTLRPAEGVVLKLLRD